MNTPTHLVVNVALLGRGSRLGRRLAPPDGVSLAAGAAALLPDVPIFVFYAVEKVWLRVPENVIWTHDYFVSAWQPVIDALHSFPLAGLALLLLWRIRWARVFCLGLLLHSALDFPLHHDDAHRHFFPFSDWRFASPVSYWDPRHHGAAGSLLELAALLVSSAALFTRHRSWKVRIPIGLLGASQTAGWLLFHAVRSFR